MHTVSKTFDTEKGILKIHGIQTGKLAIKESAYISKNPGTLSTLLSFRDKKFSKWMPIWCWLIEHPKGLYLIDTGLSTDVNLKNYFSGLSFISRYYFEKQMIFEIESKQELNNQLKNLGFETNAIDKIFLTHLHLDHTGGLKHFPEIPVIVNDREWRTQDGSFSALFPDNINFEKVHLDSNFQGFERSYYLTEEKDLIMVETQGHTRGHTSIFLELEKDKFICFSGDVTYTEDRLKKQLFSATITNRKRNIESCKRIKSLAKRKSIIFLPSHDHENVERLMNEIELNGNET